MRYLLFLIFFFKAPWAGDVTVVQSHYVTKESIISPAEGHREASKCPKPLTQSCTIVAKRRLDRSSRSATIFTRRLIKPTGNKWTITDRKKHISLLQWRCALKSYRIKDFTSNNYGFYSVFHANFTAKRVPKLPKMVKFKPQCTEFRLRPRPRCGGGGVIAPTPPPAVIRGGGGARSRFEASGPRGTMIHPALGKTTNCLTLGAICEAENATNFIFVRVRELTTLPRT